MVGALTVIPARRKALISTPPQYTPPYPQQPGYGAGGGQLPQGTQPGEPMGLGAAMKDYFKK